MKKLNLVLILIVVVLVGLLLNSLRNSASKPSEASIFYDCEREKTAFDLLQAKYPIEFKDESYGKLVTSINGIKPEGKTYWAFYIEGKVAPVGADSYKCEASEKIEWKVESY